MPSLKQVSAAQSTTGTDAATIVSTSGTANITATFLDGSDNPLIGASEVSLASTGTGNTITPVSTRTNADGVFRWTFSSTVAEAKTLTASAAGLNVTQTAAVTVSGTPPADKTPEFFSDWAGVATGSATTSKNDNGKWNVVGGSNGTGVEVVSSAGLGFPAAMTQILRVPWNNGVFNFLRKTGMDVPALGESRAYRVYQRIVLPDGTADTNQHPHQDGNAIGGTNWAWNTYNDEAAGTYGTGVQFVGEAYPNNNFYGPALDKNQTYRLEFLLTRDGSDATAFKFSVRIYDSADALVADDSDFVNDSAVSLATYCASNDLTFNSAANLDGFNAGCNDTGTETGDYGYQGGVAICDNQGFIGAYGSVTGEGTPALLFASRWANATGTSEAAIDDGNAWNGTFSNTENAGAVETLASLALTEPSELSTVDNALVTRAGATVLYAATTTAEYDAGNPSNGTTRYIRFYNAQIQPDATGDGSIGNIEHGVESAETGGGDGWNIMRIPRNNGTWRLIFRDIASGVRFAAWTTALDKDTFYRIELALTYGVSTYTVAIRVYDANRVLIADDADFTQSVGPDLGDPLTGYAMAYTAAEHRYIRVGNNGPSSNYPGAGEGTPPSPGDGMNAVTAFAYGTETWCGHYINGNG